MGALGVELVDYPARPTTRDGLRRSGLTYASHENLDELLQIYEPWLAK